jgi:hypothetical protein
VGLDVALFDRPASESQVKAAVIVVAGQVVPAIK